MEWDAPWSDDGFENIGREAGVVDLCPKHRDEDIEDKYLISIDSFLPDDLLERILAYLPIASVFKAGSVCKKWYEIVHSKRFIWDISSTLSRKPWYFMFTSSEEPIGYAYDPMLRKWYRFVLPYSGTSSWIVAASCGLVCFMDNDNSSELYLCNPITKVSKRLEVPPGLKFAEYGAHAISVDISLHSYTVAIVRSKQTPDDFGRWVLSIHVYHSKTMMWESPVTEILTGWRGGDECVISDGVLYFLIYSTRGMSWTEKRHGLVSYNLSNQCSGDKLINTFIPAPCSLTCGRLMNLKDKLVLVGGIGKQDRPGIIKGIGIWVLNGKDWEEVSRMPHKFFQGFGEFDDVFSSSGFDDLIYIQSYGATALLVFDMNSKQWKWSQKCPVTKKFHLELFTGFCFEPRLEVSP